MASIDKEQGLLRDGRQAYTVRWRVTLPDGRRKARERRVYGWDEAQRVLAEKAAEERATKRRPTELLTVAEAGTRWLADYARKPRARAVGGTVQETSWDEASRAIEALAAHVGDDTPLASLTAEDVAEAVEHRVNLRDGSPVADGTRERMAGTLKGFAHDALKASWTRVDLAADLPSRYGPVGGGRRAVVPSVTVLERLAKILDEPTQPVVTRGGATAQRPRWLRVHDPELWRPSDRLWLFALTGLDYAEAAGLRLEDDRGDHLTLEQVWPRREGKPRSHGKAAARVPREVPVPGRLRPVLDRLKAYSRCGYLLTGPDGQPLSYESWHTQLARAADTVGTDYTTKSLRHFAASLWIKAGATPLLVMKALGHSDLTMISRVYGHLWPAEVTEISRRMDRLDWDDLE